MDDAPHIPFTTKLGRHKRFRGIWIGSIVFAAALAVLPGGCCFVDASMLVINGVAVATYGGALGCLSGTRRGNAAGIVCITLGLSHPVWLIAAHNAARSLGLTNAPGPFSTVVPTASQTIWDNALLFAITGFVFAVSLVVCLRSWSSLIVLPASTALSVLSIYLLDWTYTWSGLGRLWPSSVSFPAAILHIGIAGSLWNDLRSNESGDKAALET